MQRILCFPLATLIGAPVLLAAPLGGTTAPPFPLPLDHYADGGRTDILVILQHRITEDPFNLVATIIFLLAIAHTYGATAPIRFLAGSRRCIWLSSARQSLPPITRRSSSADSYSSSPSPQPLNTTRIRSASNPRYLLVSSLAVSSSTADCKPGGSNRCSRDSARRRCCSARWGSLLSTTTPRPLSNWPALGQVQAHPPATPRRK